MGQGHPRTQLEIGRLRMEKLFHKGPLGLVRDPEGCGDLVAQDHARILKKMLDDDVLALGNTRRSLYGPEGNQGA